MAGGLSFLGRSAEDTSFSPEMQAWLTQQQPDYVPAAVAPGSSGFVAPTAPAAADPEHVLTPTGRNPLPFLGSVGRGVMNGATGAVHEMYDAGPGFTDRFLKGQIDPHSEEAAGGALGAAGYAMTGGLGGAEIKAGETALGSGPIRAYHGSPHDFDRFDISKIGTGEGEQVYGHGLYFAGNEAVAKSYRDTLSAAARSEGKWDARIKNNSEYADQLRGQLSQLDPSSAEAIKLSKRIDHFDNANMLLQNSLNGHMYEVGIDADPAKLLNWDAPVASQPRIRDLAGDMGARLRSDATGGDAYRAITDRSPIPGSDMGGLIDPEFGSAATAAQRLREAGVPGIKYLDGGSRIAGDGSHNYVTFSDDIVSILRKYGLAGLIGGGAAAGAMSQPSDAQAAEPLPFLGRDR